MVISEINAASVEAEPAAFVAGRCCFEVQTHFGIQTRNFERVTRLSRVRRAFPFRCSCRTAYWQPKPDAPGF